MLKLFARLALRLLDFLEHRRATPPTWEDDPPVFIGHTATGSFCIGNYIQQ